MIFRTLPQRIPFVFADEPVPFLYWDENEKFHLTDMAREMLQSLTEPVAIVSICGRVHQGKSFLLNQLLERSSGFEVASSSRTFPCTMGLWLWSSPVRRRIAVDGTTYNILFMDTEAIDASHNVTGLFRSIKVISLALLLSSMLIYNQMGSFDDVAVHLLSLVIEMTKNIHLQASKGRDTAPMLQQCSPILLSLIRDFRLDLVDDSQRITPQEHLKHALGTVELGGNDVAAAMNKMRESIRDFLPNRECCALVNPVIDEKDLELLDKIKLEKLRPEFRDGLATLKKIVLQRTRPKQVGGTMMTGPILVNITQMFLDALNSDAESSSWQSHEEARCLRAYNWGERTFTRRVNSRRSNKVSKEALEEEFFISMQNFDAALDDGLGNTPLCEIYRMYLKNTLEKKLVELEHVSHGDLANERVKMPLGKLVEGLEISSPQTFQAVGSVNPLCGAHGSNIEGVSRPEDPRLFEDHLNAMFWGLQFIKENLHAYSRKEFVGIGISDEDNMGFDTAAHHKSAYETGIGGVNGVLGLFKNQPTTLSDMGFHSAHHERACNSATGGFYEAWGHSIRKKLDAHSQEKIICAGRTNEDGIYFDPTHLKSAYNTATSGFYAAPGLSNSQPEVQTVGLHSRRKKDDMSFDLKSHTSAFDSATGEVYERSKTKLL